MDVQQTSIPCTLTELHPHEQWGSLHSTIYRVSISQGVLIWLSVVRRLERCRGLWEATQDDRYVAATKSRKLDPRSESYRSELYRKLEVREHYQRVVLRRSRLR